MSDTVVYSKVAQKEIDRLESQAATLRRKAKSLDNKVEAIKIGQSPIKVGHIIQWDSRERIRRGRVVSISSSWRGFTYRVHVLTQAGKEIGYAMVNESHQAVIETVKPKGK